MSVKKRFFYLDELRMIAILAVILCHIDILYQHGTTSFKLVLPYLLTNLGRMGVPIFLMISGALLLNKDYDLLFFLKKRFSRILIPFIFWVLVIGAFHYFVLGSSLNKSIDWMLGSGITWYIYELIGAYLFIPVVNAFIEKFGDTGVKYFLIIWFITLFTTTFKFHPFPSLKLGYFAGFIGYMVFGYYLFSNKFKFADDEMMLIGVVLFIVFYIINCTNSLINENFFPYMSIILALQSAGVFLFFSYANKYSQDNKDSIIGRMGNYIENGWIGKIVYSISVCSYGMYFTHTFFYKTLLVFKINSIKLLPVIFVGVVFLSWLIIYIFSKIPILDKVSGVK